MPRDIVVWLSVAIDCPRRYIWSLRHYVWSLRHYVWLLRPYGWSFRPYVWLSVVVGRPMRYVWLLGPTIGCLGPTVGRPSLRRWWGPFVVATVICRLL
jgi:hypothetical protein